MHAHHAPRIDPERHPFVTGRLVLVFLLLMPLIFGLASAATSSIATVAAAAAAARGREVPKVSLVGVRPKMLVEVVAP